MIHPISSLYNQYATAATQINPTQKPQPQPNNSSPLDTVQLSKAAQAAVAGDIDHDGDSH